MKKALTTLLTVAIGLFAAHSAFAGGVTDPTPGDTLLGKEGGIAYVSDVDVAIFADSNSALAACPHVGHRWRLFGGGVKGSAVAANLASSRPQDLEEALGDTDTRPDDYWRVSTTDAGLGTELTSYAICSKEAGVKYRSTDLPDGASGLRSGGVSCPGNRVPTMGGASIGPSDSFISTMFSMNSPSWFVAAYDDVGGIGRVGVDVICRSPGGIRAIKVRTFVPAGGQVSPRAKCPSNRHVIGGGVDVDGAADKARIISSYPVDLGDGDGIPDNGWKATIASNAAGNLGVNVFAYCLK